MIKHTDKQGNKEPRLSIEIISPEVMNFSSNFLLLCCCSFNGKVRGEY